MTRQQPEVKMKSRADFYMGIGQAIHELQRIQQHLLKFGLTEEQQLAGVDKAVKDVADYLATPSSWYRFDDLCVTEKKE